ncbi:unnamed protein product, partial [Rotaria socialis]
VLSVVVQFFLCRRLCIPFICRIEGFNSFFNGCVTTYMLVALSVVRYATTANSSISLQIQQRMEQHGWHLAIICFVMGGVWAVPSIFGRMSTYAPEGFGFHCGLDWFDRPLPGRINFFLLFFFVLFMPIIIVIHVNVYIQHTAYHLTHLRPSIVLELQQISSEKSIRRHVSGTLFEKEARRLHEDQRFVLATGISVFVYIIAWTPYSIVAVVKIFGDQFSLYNPWLMTACAVLAKLSMVTNPIVYGIILKDHTGMKLRLNTK